MPSKHTEVAEEVTRGCWVQTISGPAVCCHVVMKTTLSLDMQTDEDGEQTFPTKDEPYVYYRYEAETPKGETLWVGSSNVLASEENSEKWCVRFLREPDEVSLHVITLGGAYGRGPISDEHPDWEL